MKNNKPNQLMPQSKNLVSNSMMQGFSNPYNNFNKSRTQTVTPSMVRSPPSGIYSGSGVHKLNADYAKNQLNEDMLKQKNLQNMNMGEVSRSSTGSNNMQMNNNYMQTNNNYMQMNNNYMQMKKDFVSMEEALGFLSYINKNQNEAFKMPVIPLEQIQVESQNISRQASQHKQKQLQKRPANQTPPPSVIQENNPDQSQQEELEETSLTQNKRKLNKNRAIKRIIETAYQLLQKNYHYTSVENQLSEEQKSTSTQFNIYLKQYNRIIEQINSKEYEEIQTSNLLYDKNQDELQEVFEYTVMDDFREKLSVFFTKERLVKDNVDLMIKAFRDALVSLKINQLKVQYFDSQQPPKIIKMSQIQNVQYYTHPYIFIALTINKDKTKSKQQLYLKFSSQQNQDKWDRALYCCFISRKMTKKDKLFQIQFPVEDVMKKEKQQHKKEDQFYEVNDQYRVIDKVFRQRELGRSPASNSITHTLDHNQTDANMLSDRPEYMNLAKNRTQERIAIQEDVRRVNTVATGNKNESPFRNIEMNTNGKNTQRKDPLDKKSLTGLEQGTTPVRKEPSVFVNSPQQEQQNLSKKSTFNVNAVSPVNNNTQIHPRANTLPQGPQSKPVNTFPSSNPFMKLLKIAQEQPQRKYPQQKHPTMLQLDQQAIRRQQERLLSQKLGKLKRIRQIEKKNVRGIVCQKEKFFMNKEKIIFFYDESLLNSSRKLATDNKTEMMHLDSFKTLKSEQIQSSKYLEYWDYDYKKDEKQEKKLISVANIFEYQIIPSTLGQTTTSLVIGYNLVSGNNKMDKKELRLIFANPITSGFTSGVSFGGNLGKAEEVHEWIRLVKSI